MSTSIILTTAYLPTIEYFALIAQSEVFCLEAAESFQKQSYRNRGYIMTANGVQQLIVPTLHSTQRSCIRDVRIDYKGRWQAEHWRAIETAYSGTPYFLYFRDFFAPFYENHYEFLFDFNLEITEMLLKLFKIKKSPVFTEDFQKEYEKGNDYRNLVHPKKEPLFVPTPYHQIFDDKLPFTWGVSVIDYLFNTGPDGSYLQKLPHC